MKHQVLYIKKNLRHSAITTSKDVKILQPGPEKRGVSKKPRTLNHPVVLVCCPSLCPQILLQLVWGTFQEKQDGGRSWDLLSSVVLRVVVCEVREEGGERS